MAAGLDVPQPTIRRASPVQAPAHAPPVRALPPVGGISGYRPKAPAPSSTSSVGGPATPRRLPMPAVTAMPGWRELVGWTQSVAAPTTPTPSQAPLREVPPTPPREAPPPPPAPAPPAVVAPPAPAETHDADRTVEFILPRRPPVPAPAPTQPAFPAAPAAPTVAARPPAAPARPPLDAPHTPPPIRPLFDNAMPPALTPRPFSSVVIAASAPSAAPAPPSRPAGNSFTHVARRTTTEEFPGATTVPTPRAPTPGPLPAVAPAPPRPSAPPAAPTASRVEPPTAATSSRTTTGSAFTYVHRAVTDELPVLPAAVPPPRPSPPLPPAPEWLKDPDARPVFVADAPAESLAPWTKRERYNLMRLIGAVALRDVGTLAVGMTAAEMEDLVQRAARAGILRV